MQIDTKMDTVDRYETNSQIGEGGMAIIYAAKDKRLHREVALKALKQKFVRNEDKRARFYDEAYIMANLSHPGVIPVYDAGIDALGNHFYSMKRVAGKTLRKLLLSRRDTDVMDQQHMMALISVFERVCETVGFAHSQGIVHRDLKPDNVMVDDYGTVYVLDWGIAKRLDRTEAPVTEESGSMSEGTANVTATQDGRYMGTPAYMSPEQAIGASYQATPSSDVFALGTILYEIINGILPFEGNKPEEFLRAVVQDEPFPVEPWANKDLAAIAYKALQKDPDDRYKDAAEMLEDIRLFRAHLPVSVRKPTIVERTFNWARRNQFKAAVISTLIAVFLIAFGASSWQYYNEQQIIADVTQVAQGAEERIADLQKRIAEKNKLLTVIDVGTDQFDRLKFLVQKLEREVAVERLGASRVYAALVGFTLLSPDKEAIEKLIEQNMTVVREAMEDENYPAALAYSEYFLRNAEQSEIIKYSKEQIAELNHAAEVSRQYLPEG